MVSKVKRMRAAANDAFAQVLDVNERILKEIHAVYFLDEDGTVETTTQAFEPRLEPALLRPGKEGIMSICSKLGISCIPPRRKINVMIVGNHSAGKSSYINWYVGEHVQTTAVAMETQGFTFCTSGKKRETLKGQATMQLFPQLQRDLQAFAPSIYNGLATEVSTSKEKCFNLVTFIDTPGLVDGSFQYPFPVEDVIVAIARHTDLIYIFFDPHGQALCERTLKVIERLNLEHAEKMRYFLSKADMVPQERDRQKVVVQITQNLSSRIRNKHAFELPSLYIPDKAAPAACKIDNILENTCEEMEHTINQNVQNSLDKLEADCKLISARINELLSNDADARQRNLKRAFYGYLALLASCILVLMMAAYFLHTLQLEQWWKHLHPRARSLVDGVAAVCDALVTPTGEPDLTDVHSAPPDGLLTQRQLRVTAMAAFVVLQVTSRVCRMYWPTLNKRELQSLQQTRSHVMRNLLEKKTRLYKLYLEECNSDEFAWTI